MLSTGGTLLDGFAIFVLGVAMPLVIAGFHLTPDVVGLIGASLVLGAVFGAGFGGPMADHLGRKPLMLADMVIICAGTAASALAKGPAMLFIGQLLVGVGIGIDFPVQQQLCFGSLAQTQSRAIDGRHDCLPIAWYVGRGCNYARAAKNRRQHAELATFPGERRRYRRSLFFATSLSARQSTLVDGPSQICRGCAGVHPDYA